MIGFNCCMLYYFISNVFLSAFFLLFWSFKPDIQSIHRICKVYKASGSQVFYFYVEVIHECLPSTLRTHTLKFVVL